MMPNNNFRHALPILNKLNVEYFLHKSIRKYCAKRKSIYKNRKNKARRSDLEYQMPTQGAYKGQLRNINRICGQKQLKVYVSRGAI